MTSTARIPSNKFWWCCCCFFCVFISSVECIESHFKMSEKNTCGKIFALYANNANSNVQLQIIHTFDSGNFFSLMHFSLPRLLEGLFFFISFVALRTELSMVLTLFKYINNKVCTGRLSSPSATGWIWFSFSPYLLPLSHSSQNTPFVYGARPFFVVIYSCRSNGWLLCTNCVHLSVDTERTRTKPSASQMKLKIERNQYWVSFWIIFRDLFVKMLIFHHFSNSRLAGGDVILVHSCKSFHFKLFISHVHKAQLYAIRVALTTLHT